MAKQGIDLGTAGDLTTGDNVRDAFDKVNDNFTEVYSDIVNLQTDDANDVTQVNGPAIADTIKISNLSQVATCSVARNGSLILGTASDLTLDNQYSSFELVFTGSLKGWVIIGQN